MNTAKSLAGFCCDESREGESSAGRVRVERRVFLGHSVTTFGDDPVRSLAKWDSSSFGRAIQSRCKGGASPATPTDHERVPLGHLPRQWGAAQRHTLVDERSL